MEVKLTLSKNYRNIGIECSRNRGMFSERFIQNYFREWLKGRWCLWGVVHKSWRSEDSFECWFLGTFYLSLTSVSHWSKLHSVGEATGPQGPRDLRGSTPYLTMARTAGIYHLTWLYVSKYSQTRPSLQSLIQRFL